MTTLVQPARNT